MNQQCRICGRSIRLVKAYRSSVGRNVKSWAHIERGREHRARPLLRPVCNRFTIRRRPAEGDPTHPWKVRDRQRRNYHGQYSSLDLALGAVGRILEAEANRPKVDA